MDNNKTEKVSKSSGNVFADLNLEDAEELKIKSGLTRQILARINTLKLNQTSAAALLGIAQPDVSKLMNCRYTGFSIERLMLLLNRLSVDIEITLRPKRRSSKASGHIRLVECA